VGVISRLYNFVVGTTIDSEQVDAEFNQILGVLDGSIDPANLSAASKNLFVKLATAGDHKEAFGVFDDGLSWGLTAEHVYTIPHGLGTTPAQVSLTATTGNTTGGTTDSVIVNLQSVNATNLVVKARAVLGNGNFPSVAIHWRAVT
jgi:hypothetical protein